MVESLTVRERKCAFKKRLETFSIINHRFSTLEEFFGDAFKIFESRINTTLERHITVKVVTCFVAKFEKKVLTENGEQIESQKMYLHTDAEIIDFETDLRTFYDQRIFAAIDQKIDDVQLRGSGFRLAEILELNVQINSFDPCSGSSYIPLPKFLESKHAIINVKNRDNHCFKFAVLSALFPVEKNAQRPSNYIRYIDALNFEGLQYPIDLKQISKFEFNNPAISINVYMYDEDKKKVRTLRLTKKVKKHHIHLLLLTRKNGNAVKSHYCWIKNLSALLSAQISANHAKKNFCDRCLNHFTSSKKLQQHMNHCIDQNEYEIEMPTFESNILEFKNLKNQMAVPFVVYADIESLLKKPDTPLSTKQSEAYQQHEVFSIGYYFKCAHDDSLSYYRSKRGVDCVEWFVQELHDIAKRVDVILNQPKHLNMSMEDEVLFIMSDDCHICGRKFLQNDVKVRDHSHVTGQFRGAAHQKCNLSYQEAHYVPIIFHNLSNYDAHFIVRTLSNNIPGHVTVIPCTDERYVSFTKAVPSRCGGKFHQFIKLRFVDSFRFMTSSLDYLSSLLPFREKKILQSQCRNLSNEQTQMLQRKGVFCYDYIDSWTRLDETSLPSKDSFFSVLTGNHISDDEYEFARKVWAGFNLRTLGEYSDLYMKTDILLLADVFEHFRQTCHDIYKLDPAHYFTAPGLSFDAMLKHTQVRIELLTDVDMLLFIERGIRGGISQCSKRYSKANNKFMNDYDQSHDPKFLMYLDANNLYGYSMMQCLPLDNFQWDSVDEFTTERIMNILDESSTGYIFEVDLDYPQDLHDLHKDYPFCAENRCVPHTKNEKKLLLTLFHKKNYVIHYKMLKCALRNGLVLNKVHKVLKFNQSQWLKPYIMLNTELRTQATNEFEKNLYKLLINAIYGKTMENMRSRVDIQLKTTWDGRYGARNLIAKPNFKRVTIFDENLVAVELKQILIRMNKPIAIGMTVLDLSKVLMYDFYYSHMKPKYGTNVEMLYTDTDSFILEIKTACIYTDMLQHLDKYDTSDYPMENKFNIPRVNKKVPGLFKDELHGEIMTEFVGLRSKMYCVKSGGVEKMKKAKGVKKCVLDRSITFEHYMSCIRDNCIVVRNQNTICSKKHRVFTIKQTRVALSAQDNKRYILPGGIDTLPWGHFRVQD